MSPEEILIRHNGYTDTAYSSCGERQCTTAILRAVGVPERQAADPESVNNLSVGIRSNRSQVTVALLGESDSCEFCAACGSFIRHGLVYPGDDVGCMHELDEDGDAIDPEHLDGPHVYLRDNPIMADFL